MRAIRQSIGHTNYECDMHHMAVQAHSHVAAWTYHMLEDTSVLGVAGSIVGLTGYFPHAEHAVSKSVSVLVLGKHDDVYVISGGKGNELSKVLPITAL